MSGKEPPHAPPKSSRRTHNTQTRYDRHSRTHLHRLAVASAADLEDVGELPRVIQVLRHEERALDEREDVLREYAPVARTREDGEKKMMML